MIVNSKKAYLNIYINNSFNLAFYCLIKVNSCNKIKIGKKILYNNIKIFIMSFYSKKKTKQQINNKFEIAFPHFF